MSEKSTQLSPEETVPTLTQEEIDTAERIIKYAKTQQDFVWVYRAEGEKDPKHMHSAGGEILRGTWFTPSWENAQRYATERAHIPGMKTYALIIPKQLLNMRENMDVGMNQVNILSPQLLDGKRSVESSQTSIPTVIDYCTQIDVIKKYADSKNYSIEKLLAE